jgi:hypothetical protein
MAAENSDHDGGPALDPFAAEDAPGSPGSIAALKDEDPSLDVFGADADLPSWVTVAPRDEDSVSLFLSESVAPVSASPAAPQRESVFVSPPAEAPFASAVRSEPASREGSRGQWRGAAAAIAIAVLISAGLLGALIIDRQAVPLPAAPLNSAVRLPPSPALPTADRPIESVTPTTTAAPLPLRSEADDAPSQETAARTTARGRSVSVAEARTTQPRGPASRPAAPAPSPSVPASRAQPVPTANVPTPEVPTKAPAAPALNGVGATTPGVAAPAALAVAPPDPAPSPAVAVADTEAVGSILTRYRSAFSALDANAVEAVWPSVNSRALANAFGQLESQSFDLGTCQIDVQGSRADAVCSGWASFVPKVGGNRRRVEARQWTFHLVRTGTTWLIGRVDSRQDAARSP